MIKGENLKTSYLKGYTNYWGLGHRKQLPTTRWGMDNPSRTIINMLKTLNDKEKTNWNTSIIKLAFAYNSTINKSTGFSPYFLMFGRSARLPIDSIFGIEPEKSNTKTYNKFVEEWQEKMKTVVEIAQGNIEKMGKNNEKSHKKVRGNEIKVGDQVLLTNFEKGGPGKLKSYWEKTVYVVKDKNADVPVYTICPEGKNKIKRVHRNNIMKCNFILPGEQQKHKPKRKQGNGMREESPSSEDEVIVYGRDTTEGKR